MQWIILLLITLVLVALRGFFGRQRRQQRWERNKGRKSKRDVVVPRQTQLARDMEVGEEFEPVTGDEVEQIPIGVGSGADDFLVLHKSPYGLHDQSDAEFRGELPASTEVRKIITRKHRDEANLHHRAEKYHHSALITPIQPAKARSPKIEGFRFADTLQEKEGTTMIGEPNETIGVELEVSTEVGMIELPETNYERIRVLQTDTPAHYQIHIGVTPSPIPAHEMPLHLEVSPSLTALVKDPYWAFVYWSLPPETPQDQWELRVQNISEQTEFFERVDPSARRWYLHLNQPNARFAFELGVRDTSGHFTPVLFSGQIQMPPDRPSDQIDTDWLSISELYLERGALRPHGSAAFAMELGGASEFMLKQH